MATTMTRNGSRSGSINVRPNLPNSMPSTLNDIPVATNSIVNKVASASSSLYQNCRILLGRLYRVPGFADEFMDSRFNLDGTVNPNYPRQTPLAASTSHPGLESSGSTSTLSTVANTTTPLVGDGLGGTGAGGLSNDPVSRSLHTLRLGSSLCYLFNALGLDHQLEVNPAATMTNLKACQRGTAHFIMACKQDLRWTDQDLFAIHELYGQDTNGVVKVGFM
jgi:cell division control protein 24